MLPPRAHVALLRDELGEFAVVCFHEVDGFLPFVEPEFGLGHKGGGQDIALEFYHL